MKRKCQDCKKIKEPQTVMIGGRVKVNSNKKYKVKVLGYKCNDCDPPRNTDNDLIIKI